MDSRLALPLLLAASVTLLLCSTAWAHPNSSRSDVSSRQRDDPSRPCLHYDGDGCSIPFGLPFFYKKQFTLSCDKHDVCYHCGVAYSVPRPRCDAFFRNNTLATCKQEYLRLPSRAYSDANTRTDSHEARVLKALEEHGMDALKSVFLEAISDLLKVHPVPTIEEFEDWFSSHENQVRMLAEWTKDLAGYLQQTTTDQSPASVQRREQFLPSRDTRGNSGGSNTGQTDWCAEVKNYLRAHNETLPPSSGIVCKDISYLTCNFFSEVYFLAVRTFAYFSYRRTPEFYCHESWVPKCLPNPPSTTLKFIGSLGRPDETP